MKKILFVVNVVLVLLVFFLFYRANKSDEKTNRISSFLEAQDFNIVENHRIQKDNEISKLTYLHILDDGEWEKISEHPYFYNEIDEVLYNPKKYGFKNPNLLKFYASKDTLNYDFFVFNQANGEWKNYNSASIEITIGKGIKIVKKGEDPKTAKDIRNRN